MPFIAWIFANALLGQVLIAPPCPKFYVFITGYVR